MVTLAMRMMTLKPLATGAPMMPTARPRKSAVMARTESGAVTTGVGLLMISQCRSSCAGWLHMGRELGC